jgi:hypothetical protein
MKKIINKIKNYFKHRTVYIRDQFYDYLNDNDDLYDIPTIVEVTYSNFRGIINVDFTDRRRESDLRDIAKFYSTCKINEYGGLSEYKKYSIYGRQ